MIQWIPEQTLYDMGLSKTQVHKMFKKCSSKNEDDQKWYKNEDVERIIENPNNQKKIQRTLELKQKEKDEKIVLNSIMNNINESCKKLDFIPYKEIRKEAIEEEATFKGISKKQIFKMYSENRIEYVTFKYIRHYYVDGYLKNSDLVSKVKIDGYKDYKRQVSEAIVSRYPSLKEEADKWVNDNRKKSDKAYSMNKLKLDEVRAHVVEEKAEEYVLTSPEILKYGRISRYTRDGQYIDTCKGIDGILAKAFKNTVLYSGQAEAEQRKMFNALTNEIMYQGENGKEYICKLVRHPEKTLEKEEVKRHQENTALYKEMKNIVSQGRMNKMWKVMDDTLYVNNSNIEIKLYPVSDALDKMSDLIEQKAKEHYDKTGNQYIPKNKTEQMIINLEIKERNH